MSQQGRNGAGGPPASDAQATDPATGGQGAQPSHRAPHRYVEGEQGPCRVLRWAVDSLDLSFQGQISDKLLRRLDDLKETAKSEEEAKRATAQITIGDHLFAVKAHGRGRFRFVLEDERFFIQVSKGQSLPLAYAQISSEYLTSVGVQAATDALRYVVNSLGRVDGHEHVSRVDPCVDFIACVPVDAFDRRQWITRAREKAAYWLGDEFSGWKIGVGGAVQSRLYDKLIEVLEKSHKFYLFDLWAQGGWKEGQHVWRQEFQVARAALKELQIDSVAHLLANLGALWNYLTGEWLRLANLSEDSNRARWPSHALWAALAAVNWTEMPQPTLKRIRSSALPRDEQIFTAFPGYIASFMAREGITDWGEGLGEALRQADEFHRANGGKLSKYVERKVKAKGRLLSTINNREGHPDDLRRIRQEEAEYRRAKDGE